MLVKITMALFWGAASGVAFLWIVGLRIEKFWGAERGCIPAALLSLVAGIAGAVLAWNAG